MLFFAMTKPKKKLGWGLRLLALIVLLAVLVPAGYAYLSERGALTSFSRVTAGAEAGPEQTIAAEDERQPGEALLVEGQLGGAAPAAENAAAERSGVWSRLKALILGEPAELIVYERKN